MSPLSEFSLEEMAWMRADGTMDESLTELTATPDDAEFERAIFLIRTARQLADLDRSRILQWQTKLAGQRVEKILSVFYRIVLISINFLFSNVR